VKGAWKIDAASLIAARLAARRAAKEQKTEDGTNGASLTWLILTSRPACAMLRSGRLWEIER